MTRPDGLWHRPAQAVWDTDAVRDGLRDYVVDRLGHRNAVLIDEARERQKTPSRWVFWCASPEPVGVSKNPSKPAGLIGLDQHRVRRWVSC